MWKRMEQFSSYLLLRRSYRIDQSVSESGNHYDISLFNDIK